MINHLDTLLIGILHVGNIWLLRSSCYLLFVIDFSNFRFGAISYINEYSMYTEFSWDHLNDDILYI